MKLKALFAILGAAGLTLGGAGCTTHKTTVPLTNSFEFVSHPYHTLIDDPPPPRVALQREVTKGTITPIWPALYSTDTVIQGGLVLFVAERAYTEPERVTHARLFAARPPAPPEDLTDEILWRWSKANGRDFGTALQKLAAVDPVSGGDGVNVSLQFWGPAAFNEAHQDWPDSGMLHLSWSQVDELMQIVKTKGVPLKDLHWHTDFIGEKY